MDETLNVINGEPNTENQVDNDSIPATAQQDNPQNNDPNGSPAFVQNAEQNFQDAEENLQNSQRDIELESEGYNEGSYPKIREIAAQRRERRAESHNDRRSNIQRLLGKDKQSEASIAEEDAVAMDERIDRLLNAGTVQNRTEAMNQLFYQDLIDRGYDKDNGPKECRKYFEALEDIQEAKEALELAQSMILIEDPKRAEILATAEKEHQDAAVELEKLGLHEKAEEVRANAHQAAVEATLQYEIDRPVRDKMKTTIEEKILQAILTPGKEICIHLQSGHHLLLGENFTRRRSKEEDRFVDEYIFMCYEVLHFDFSQRAVSPEEKPSGFNGRYESYSTGNDAFKLYEVHTYYGPSSDSRGDTKIPSEIYIYITKFAEAKNPD